MGKSKTRPAKGRIFTGLSTHFDYIIIGAGASGLSLAIRMIDELALKEKRILLIDRTPKTLDDRTWCYWEKNPGYFEAIVYKKWEQLFIRNFDGEIALDMGGYTYKMIRGIDFYKYCFLRLSSHPHVKLVYGHVHNIDAANGAVSVDEIKYTGEYIFSSVMNKKPVLQKRDRYLLQHFRGWWIETEKDFFDPDAADLMNFRVSQQHGCAFVYVMPVSRRKALVEYTLFSSELLQPEQYDLGIDAFIEDELKPGSFQIEDVENGVIPMTSFQFPVRDGKLIYIGTAGGQTKASTGYTFQNIQKHSDSIIKGLVSNKPSLLVRQPAARFRFYDRVLLRILDEKKIGGADVFFRMFKKNAAHKVLKFLDNESSILEELQIMKTTPQGIFIRASVQEWN